MDGFLTDETVEHVKQALFDKEYREKMVDHNYRVASRFFSYRRVEDELRAILGRPRLTPPCAEGVERQ